MWEIFRKYHYLNTDLNPACRQFVGVINGEIVCHTGVIPTPMQKNSRRLHRSVVLPDYQGIGIGMNFKNAVCDYIRHSGYDGIIWSVTTTPAQYHAQVKSPKWKLVRYGRASRHVSSKLLRTDMRQRIARNSSASRITYAFVYVGDEGKEHIVAKEAL
jgi:GNAT superfamily N-acetyltransferase